MGRNVHTDSYMNPRYISTAQPHQENGARFRSKTILIFKWNKRRRKREAASDFVKLYYQRFFGRKMIASIALTAPTLAPGKEQAAKTQTRTMTQTQTKQQSRTGSGSQTGTMGAKTKAGNAYGPGDGTGNGGVGPKDGTGYGAPGNR
jgi:hypothetical protein